jgi:hypothetical protein
MIELGKLALEPIDAQWNEEKCLLNVTMDYRLVSPVFFRVHSWLAELSRL